MKNTIAITLAAAFAAACAAPQGTQSTAPAAPRAVAAPAACAPAPSELVVKDLTPGSGPPVGYRTAVTVFYTGWLYDGCRADFKGKQFDGNVGKPAPFGFMVGAGRVIRGWDEGLVGMKAGGKRLLVIQPNKAYGAREFPDGRIPPNSTLVFEVELANIIQPAGG